MTMDETRKEYIRIIVLILGIVIVGVIANTYLENEASYEAKDQLIKDCNYKIELCNSQIIKCASFNQTNIKPLNYDDYFQR